VTIQRMRVDTPNGPHFVRRAGHGPPMMVVPGGPGLGAEYMIEPVIRLLGDQHELLFVDQRGTGESSVGTGPLTVEAFVEDMAAVADALGLDRLDLLGSSFGGLQVLLFAVAYPDRVRRIVVSDGDPPTRQLFGMVWGPDSPFSRRVLPEDQAEIERITAIPDWMSDQELLDRYLIAYFRAFYLDPRTAGTIQHGLDAAKFTQMGATSRSVRDTLGDWDFTADLASVIAPVLLVYCRDSIFGASTPEVLRDVLPNATLALVDGGHLPFIEDPQAFTSAVRGFFQSDTADGT
jgi:proline iminopeptidase